MKIIIITLLFTAMSMISCKKNNEIAKVEEDPTIKYEVYGDSLPEGTVLTADEMFDKYASMGSKDTISVLFKSKIDEVCQKKGCWAKFDLKDDAKALVRFKDHGFFAPLTSANHDAIVFGKAYIRLVPVKELKLYALSSGKTEAEIEQITEPKETFFFEADGIKIAIRE